MVLQKDAASELYDALADSYDLSFSRPIDLAENTFVQQWLQQRVMRASSVYDMGCGAGAFLDLFPKYRNRYTGVDISEGMLARAREKHPDYASKFLRQDMLGGWNDPRSRGHSLVVCLFGSCNYVPLDEFERATARALADAGWLYAIFLTPAYLARQHYGFRDGSTLWRPATRSMLTATFNEWNGWQHVQIRPLNVFGEHMNSWPWSARWLHSYLRLESKVMSGLGRWDNASFLLLSARRV